MVVPFEVHGPCHRLGFQIFASLLFEERPLGPELVGFLVTLRTPVLGKYVGEITYYTVTTPPS